MAASAVQTSWTTSVFPSARRRCPCAVRLDKMAVEARARRFRGQRLLVLSSRPTMLARFDQPSLLPARASRLFHALMPSASAAFFS